MPSAWRRVRGEGTAGKLAQDLVDRAVRRLLTQKTTLRLLDASGPLIDRWRRSATPT